jgi:hypothetical protein
MLLQTMSIIGTRWYLIVKVADMKNRDAEPSLQQVANAVIE